MFTLTPHTRLGRGPIIVILAALAAATYSVAGQFGTPPAPPSHAVADEEELEGMDERVKPSRRPSVEATFTRESYRPGSVAKLVVSDRAPDVSVRFFRAGLEGGRIKARDLMAGRPVSHVIRLGTISGRRVVRLQIGDWPSGFYFAKLTAPRARVGFASFVVRPRKLGEHRIAVVMPTHTWQAYNFRDDNLDGRSDTWYAGGNTARLVRPFSDTRGVPPHYKYYDQPFLRWLAQTGRAVDYLAQADFDAIRNGKEMARLYTLVVFPGHHEYVTTHEYDVIAGFRNRGGNLMFLSANNFFWKIEKRGNLMTRISKWRDLGRPEAGLIGVQYFHNDNGEHRGEWVVRKALPWLFAGTGLRTGSRFGSGGIEADRMYSASPSNVQVIAEIPNLYGAGMTAQMTYYERGDAKVFAGGAFTMAGSVWWPQIRQMMGNLWTRLSQD